MFLTYFRAPRFTGTGSGHILVPGVHKSVALAIENVLVEITWFRHSELDREWNEDVGGIFFGFMGFYWDVYKHFW